MSIKNIKLVSGRVPVIGPTTVTSDRYQFLGLDQAEPNLGISANGNVLTTNIYGDRIWSNVLSLSNLVVGNVQANTVTTTNGLFWANGTPFTNYGNIDVAAYLPTYTGNISPGNVSTANIYTDTITPYNTPITVFNSSTAIGLPVGATVDRPTGATGYLRYNTDTSSIEYYTGATWIAVTNTITDQIITPDGVNTTFTLSQATTTVSIIVSINGVLQQPNLAYSVTDDQITFVQVPEDTDIIDVRFLGASVTLNTTLTDDLFVSGNITLSGILTAPQTTKASTSPGTTGQVCWDTNYIYVCTSTNTWKRSPLTGGY